MCIIADAVGSSPIVTLASINVIYKGQPKQLMICRVWLESLTKKNAVILPVYNPTNDASMISYVDIDLLDQVIALFKQKDQSVRKIDCTNDLHWSQRDEIEVKDQKELKTPTKTKFTVIAN